MDWANPPDRSQHGRDRAADQDECPDRQRCTRSCEDRSIKFPPRHLYARNGYARCRWSARARSLHSPSALAPTRHAGRMLEEDIGSVTVPVVRRPVVGLADLSGGFVMAEITFRRVYEDSSAQDGRRVLVDRIWPRGVRKNDVHMDEWLREVAPSSDLRKWYGHEPARFPEFRRRYRAELRDAEHRQAAGHLRELAAHDKLTLLTATRDVAHSQAAVLAEWLSEKR